jgi:hypothetical protein
VPLAFNVYVNGVEKTDPSGLTFSLTFSPASVACAGGTAGSPVAFETVGGGVKYAGKRFQQNWKTPKQAGCYVVRMTTTADGLSLTANFKVD